MLVLTRKVGEEIVIGDHVHVTVVAIMGDKVRLGISAPKDVIVDRQEVHEKRQGSISGEPAVLPTPTSIIGTMPA